MSVFGSILGKIFGHANAAPAPAPGGQPSPAPNQSSFNNPASASPSPGQTGGAAPQPSSGAPATVDVEQVLTDLASKNSQSLDWRHSIVDLLKLLDLDSSHASRNELAKELGYTGSTDDSAAMNVWLHKQVMQKLAANGGKVPDDLK